MNFFCVCKEWGCHALQRTIPRPLGLPVIQSLQRHAPFNHRIINTSDICAVPQRTSWNAQLHFRVNTRHAFSLPALLEIVCTLTVLCLWEAWPSHRRTWDRQLPGLGGL